LDKFSAIQIFVRVVDSGSFTAAAEQLGISRAMASKLVQGLEDSLGIRLLNRTTRRLSLTGPGQSYYQRTSEILAQLAEAESEAAQAQNEPRGRLRISAPTSFGVRHLAATLGDYQRRFRQVEIDLNLSDRMVDLVDEGFDLAIRISILRDSSLIARRLAPCRIVVVASPAYLVEHGTPQHPNDLQQHNCLVYTLSTRGTEWTFLRGEETQALRLSGALSANNGDFIAAAAVAGVGVAVLPSFIVADDLRAGRVVPLLCEWRSPSIAVYAVYAQTRTLPAKTRSLIDFLAERFGPEPYWDDGLGA